MKKRIVLLVIIVFLVGCSKEKIKELKSDDIENVVIETVIEPIELLKTNEYIDVDNTTTKFLFKTNKGATVEFFIGENSTDLKLVKTISNYDYIDGLDIINLVAGENYYYQIISKNEKYSVKSEVLEFNKMSKIIYNESATWAKTAIFYEVFVRSFYDEDGDGIGDFNGLTKKLDYLQDLGVNALWLMPITESPSYHGYDTVDYCSVNTDYGTLDELKNLVDEAHKKDIKVVIDFVANHTSSNHIWFKKALRKDEKYRDYYVWADIFDSISKAGEWGQKVYQSKNSKDFYLAIFWEGMPDLNFRNREVREDIKKAAEFWVDLGIDGFRLDASKHIDDNSEVTHLWWQEFNEYIKSINPNFFLVGENWDSNINVIAPYFKDMDSSFNFAISEMIVKVVNGQSNQNIVEKILQMHEVYKKDSPNFIDSTFIRNHDMSRTYSELLDNKDKTKLAASILLTIPGTPFIYYGEEIGQKGKKPDENIREPFDWYKDANGQGMTSMNIGGFNSEMKFTKENDNISLEEEIIDSNSIYNHYKKLINIRNENHDFFYDNYSIIDLGNHILSYEVGVSKNIIVIHNIFRKEQEINLEGIINENSKELLNDIELKKNIIMKPYETIIIMK